MASLSFRKRGERGKVPIVRIVQILIALVLGTYVAFLWTTHRDSGALTTTIPTSTTTITSAAATTTTTTTAAASAAIVIGYAVSVTGCGSDPLSEGAAVLKHSIHLAHAHGGKYDYQMYALYHPEAAACVQDLADLGYTLLKRSTPVAVADIRGAFLREHIQKNGCCGEKELIKLEAYTLTQHPVVVHLDLDVLILQPLDSLFDIMIHGKTAAQVKIPVQWPAKDFPEKPNAFITRDYNMNQPGNPYPPVQGGFLVLRPDLAVYQEYLEIIREGDFHQGDGWGGKVGAFYGGMTIQGLVPYYYDVLHPQDAVELDPCRYNQMCHNPRDKPTVHDQVHGKCRTGQEECEDCRSLDLDKVITTHFTLCQKPWGCFPQDEDRIQARLCRKLHHAWFQVRSSLEQSWGRSGYGEYLNSWQQGPHFFGYCSSPHSRGYVPVAKPYGPAATNTATTRP